MKQDLKPQQTQTNHLCQAGHRILKETCKDCRALRSEWYEYLEHSGFTDIEDSIGLKDRGSLQALESKSAIFHSQQNYYQWARSKLNDGRFNSETDRLIWEYHTEGLSKRQIAPRIGLEQSWTGRKINLIKSYLKEAYDSVGSITMVQGIA